MVPTARGGGCGAGCSGEVESALTGLFPYARYRVSGKFSVWGALGHGQGDLTLTPEGARPIEAGRGDGAWRRAGRGA